MRSLPYIILILIATLLFLPCCRQEKEKDSQMKELQKDIQRLSAENQKLVDEIQSMRRELGNINPQTQTVPKSEPEREKMTVEKMKSEVAPLLKSIIEKIKENTETPKQGSHYGMRTEYDLPHASYGLVRNESREIPYHAKVIVRYEKFLESDEVSRSYGQGSSTFLFAYRVNRWVLESYN